MEIVAGSRHSSVGLTLGDSVGNLEVLGDSVGDDDGPGVVGLSDTDGTSLGALEGD